MLGRARGGGRGAPCPSGHPFPRLTRAPAGSRTVGWGGGRPRAQELLSTRHPPGCSLWPQGPPPEEPHPQPHVSGRVVEPGCLPVTPTLHGRQSHTGPRATSGGKLSSGGLRGPTLSPWLLSLTGCAGASPELRRVGAQQPHCLPPKVSWGRLGSAAQVTGPRCPRGSRLYSDSRPCLGSPGLGQEQAGLNPPKEATVA